MNDIKINCAFDKMVHVDELIPNPRNPNRHSIEQVEYFARVVRARGIWRSAIVVSNLSGFINAGHLRLEVAKHLGMTHVPVDYQDFENEAHEVEQLAFDNEIAKRSELDKHQIHINLEEIEDIDIDFMGIENFNFETLEPEDLSDKNKEIDTDNFGNDLEQQCPKCGFEFNA